MPGFPARSSPVKEDRELAHHGQRVRCSGPTGPAQGVVSSATRPPPAPTWTTLFCPAGATLSCASSTHSPPHLSQAARRCPPSVLGPCSRPCACLPPLPLVIPGLISGSTRSGCSFVACCCCKLAHIHPEALLSLKQFSSYL